MTSYNSLLRVSKKKSIGSVLSIVIWVAIFEQRQRISQFRPKAFRSEWPRSRLVPWGKRQALVLVLVVRGNVEVDLVRISACRMNLEVHGLHREGGVPRLTAGRAAAAHCEPLP